LTIVGSGIGEYNLSRIPHQINLESFDRIICDKNFKGESQNILKLSYKGAKSYILENYKDQNILYIVTGSPLFFSAGTIIAKQIPKSYLKIILNTSSKDYILSKIGISEGEVEAISLHGRSKLDLDRFLKRRFTLILTDEKSIKRLLEATKYLKSKNLTWIIGYKMGYDDEFIGEFDPQNHHFDLKNPYVILLKREFNYPNYPLADSDFLTERGMITKKYKRDLALQFLELSSNMSLWDIGAGSGSCGIEAFRRYRVKSYFFEKNPKRVEFIKQNLAKHNVCDAEILEGEASSFFENMKELVDRVFVGGGGDEVLEKLDYLFERLKDKGIMVIMAVTLRTLTKATQTLEENRINYDVISLSLTSWKNKLKMAEPQRELFIIRVLKS